MQLQSVFKAYDVRGVVPDELDASAAERIGAAFAVFSGSDRIVVGRDCRVSSPSIAGALIAGITGAGVDVDDLGEVTTDLIYYASGAESVPGVMVTASHNPPEYNGLKFCLAGAAPVGTDSGLDEVRALAESGIDPAAVPGTVRRRDLRNGFVDHVLGIIDVNRFRPITVAVDGGNGMAGVVVPQVFERLPARLHGLYLDPDGTFPNHPADPLRPENLQDLLVLMEETGADVGVAFDGDADRAFFVDDRLEPLPGSTTTAIIARWFLEREPGAGIVHNLICSRSVPETIRNAGGVPTRTRVGHSFIKGVMKETGAVFGGEHSGHYYFRDNYRADSGILAMLILLQVLSEDGRPLSQVRADYEPYAASGEINLPVADRAAGLAQVEAAFAGEAAIDRLDGLTVEWPDRWFNLRPSNTEPLLRLNAEAPDAAGVEELVGAVRRALEGP
jgi:phosphomannomutase